ncbi:hypothetical protein [Streptomyces iconiensis]|uniref:Uncharacterized protein n=1 Tax=Streptomyces iconiensis TaxID=1384038 RepID=A0ABT7A8G0_9ACTN|nr:hypothetical protein [Streptomyces iconiensis]MDJ1137126.1 hypothetical protein [Streptomyces iconiensis]
MHDNGTAHAAGKVPTRSRRLLRWAHRRRRTALSLWLRGACYGAGTGAVSFATFWLRNHM